MRSVAFGVPEATSKRSSCRHIPRHDVSTRCHDAPRRDATLKAFAFVRGKRVNRMEVMSATSRSNSHLRVMLASAAVFLLDIVTDLYWLIKRHR